VITTNTLSDLNIHEDSRVLFILPHPDDESIFIGGLLHMLARHHITTRVVTMTVGEKSTLRYGLSPKADLAETRKAELSRAFGALGVSHFSILNFPDGTLDKQRQKIQRVLTKEIRQFKPTHVVSLEPDGVYGHPDHIALTSIVKTILKKPIRLLYATVSPHYVLPSASWMAKKKITPLPPDIKLHLNARDMIAKLRGLRAHRSCISHLPIAA
jgi:LmbE family N-acetylglucosaminyl deacetylase